MNLESPECEAGVSVIHSKCSTCTFNEPMVATAYFLMFRIHYDLISFEAV